MNRVALLLSIISHFVNKDVLSVIESAVIEAATHGEWSNGEKSAFVEDKARAAAAASSNRYDDFLVEIAIKLYVARTKSKK